MARKPTEGEELFDKYLAENESKWSPWPDTNKKNPDRIVHTTGGDVVCEIKDFGANNEYRELIANYKEGKSSAGRCDLSKATSKRIWDAINQLAMVKDGRPTMVVLYNPGYLPHELDPFVREALYGQPQIAVSIGPKAPAELLMQYGSSTKAEGNEYNKGLFLKTELAHVSAVAVLETFQLNKQVFENSFSAFYSDWEKNNPSERNDGVKVLSIAEEHEKRFSAQYGPDYLAVMATRLRIYYNPNATVALTPSIFAGRYDIHVSD